jgi:hypothetical protein
LTFDEIIIHALNVVVEGGSLLLHITEVPGSNLGLEIGYPDRHFMTFLSPSERIFGY